MIYPVSRSIAVDGGVALGGVPVADLVDTYSSPLYVLDKDTLAAHADAYLTAVSQYSGPALVLYAAKANATVGLLRYLSSLGLGVDVVSMGEIETAVRAGVDVDKMVFHGNNKSLAELERALELGCRIVVDHVLELDRIIAISAKQSRSARVLLRLKPGIDAHTHTYIKTGQMDSKFGIEDKDLPDMIRKIKEAEVVELLGFHGHIGSQIFDTQPYLDLVAYMIDKMRWLREEWSLTVSELNLGGGLGVQYEPSDDPPSVSDCLLPMISAVESGCQQHDLPLPRLLFEPGRSMVATAGATVYKVGAIKPITGHDPYIFVDGGMADNMRPLLYGSAYTIEMANKVHAPVDRDYAIAGPYCESGDVLARSVSLPTVEVDDLMIVYGTGAYNFSMASNYNRNCRPAMVLVGDGKADLLLRRETLNDVLSQDVDGDIA